MERPDHKDESEQDASANSNNTGERENNGGFLRMFLNFLMVVVIGVFVLAGLVFGACLLG